MNKIPGKLKLLVYTNPSIHGHTNLQQPFTLTTGPSSRWLLDTELPPCYLPQVLASSLTTMIGKREKEQRPTLWCAPTYILMFKGEKKALQKDYLSRRLHAGSKVHRVSFCHSHKTICSYAAKPFRSYHTGGLIWDTFNGRREETDVKAGSLNSDI